jgi:hypothetical protein
MQLILKEIEAQEIVIRGEKFPAIFSHKAIALCEDYTDVSYMLTLARLKMDMLTGREIIGLIYGVLTAAGVECSTENLEVALTKQDEDEILPQIKKLIEHQNIPEDEGKTKNARSPEKGQK